MEFGVTPKRHNPIDSICRKLQTIQRRGRELSSPFQIPKLQSSSYDSPHTGLRCNLDSILKKRNGDAEQNISPPLGVTPAAPRVSGRTPGGPLTPLSPVNTTYTITGTLAEKSSVAPGHNRAWHLSCSTPAVQKGDALLSFTPVIPSSDRRFSFTPSEKETSKASAHGRISYLNFCTSDASTTLDSELLCPARVVKRLSMGDGASVASEYKKESLPEVSLICEEDLLDTIFQACDTQCRGKVYVSHIVDYLRHTTSRSSEDSGLEDLCNMLDPEHKDISIDLDTYHAIMKEWIEDCRNQVKDDKDDTAHGSIKMPDNFSAKKSFLLNLTSGSLEAFGGEASRVELETSDLVLCVADLQFTNRKLQDEVRKLKQTTETMEETNQRLMEENEELKTRAKMGQQLLQKECMLKEEVEELKLSLGCSEENRVQVSTQSKHLERENQILVCKIAALQDENLKVCVESDELQKNIKTLYELNGDLQAQIHSFDAAVTEKDTLIQEKTRQIEELKSAVMEYSSVTDLLREEKNKLESQMQMLQPDMAIPGLSLSVAYRLNQTSSGSLETELALAQQNPAEGAELHSSICWASPLDETLDREVLLLLQGPTPEQMSVEFKLLISRLMREFHQDTLDVLAVLPSVVKNQQVLDPKLQALQLQLEQRRREWTHGLERLKQYTDSLEKELLKMTSNMRRSRTEILHLSVRLQEHENHKLLLHEELDEVTARPDRSRDAGTQTDPPQVCVVDGGDDDDDDDDDDDANSSLEWDRVYPLLDSPSEEESADSEKHVQEHDEKRPLPLPLPPLPAAAADDDDDDDGAMDVQKTRCGDAGKQEVNAARETACDVEAETIRGTAASRGRIPRNVTDTGTFDFPREDHREAQQKEVSFPACIVLDDTHEQAVCCSELLSHSYPQCDDEATRLFSELRPPHTPDEATRLFSELRPPHTPDEATRLFSELRPPHTPDEATRLFSELRPPHTPDEATRLFSELRPPHTPDEATRLFSELRPLHTPEMVHSPADCSTSGQPFSLTGSASEEAPGPEGEQDVSNSMSSSQKLIQEQNFDACTVPERSGLLPVAEEEEPMMSEASQQAAAGVRSKAASGGASVTKENGANVPLTIRSRIKKDLETPSVSMETIGEQTSQEDNDAPDKNGVVSENGETVTEDGLTRSEKEMEAEFLRLSLSHRCDMFTLEKRLRLEERSRNLAEENVRKEVSSCQGLLQALIPLCGDDNPSLEIIQRLQKNLEILLQSVTRVASRSEMLGSIHQESRMGNAIEVMIQHVENLRRTYTKEHAELLDLRENYLQKERSFISHTDRDELRKKKVSAEFYKVAARRVSIATIPRSTGALAPTDTVKDGVDVEKLGHHSVRNVLIKSTQRAPLKRFISCTEVEAPAFRNSSNPTFLPTTNPSPTTEPVSPFTVKAAPPELPEGPKGVCTWAALMVVLAAFVAVLGKMLIQPAADAAPVGTGDSWTAIQQILWPYTGLRHNGQPPV